MATETTLHSLFIDELRDVYHAERQLVRALPRLAKAAASDDLRQAIEHHLEETENHVSRLEQAFETLGTPARAKTCAGMLGIVEEGSDVVKEHERGAALDAGIIAGAQRAEHYEIAAYGTILAWAKAMGHDDIVELLTPTLEEEKAADAKLTDLAENGINSAAQPADGQADGEARPNQKTTSRLGELVASEASSRPALAARETSRRTASRREAR